ncbi:hypothetical protein AB0K67_11075 [Nonomuraea sp. NPDC052634]|uniref:hypothetical protein n=1 Tax=Nonomuraea sp. NPDC052634 TaxID=3155813 RepID=UPI00341C6D96
MQEGTHEAQFRRFLAWCDQNTDVCGHGMGARWRRLVAGADREPLPVDGARVAADRRHLPIEDGADEQPLPGGDARVTYTGFDMKVAAMPHLFAPGPAPGYPRWRQLAQAIRQAEGGDAGGFAAYVRAGTGSLKPPSLVGMNATQCLDGLRFRDHREYRKVRALGERRSPNLAGAEVWHRLGCAGWPTPATNPARALPEGLPPFLGAGTWTDYTDTADLVRRVPGSRTVRFDGPGHGLYLTGTRTRSRTRTRTSPISVCPRPAPPAARPPPPPDTGSGDGDRDRSTACRPPHPSSPATASADSG